MDVDDRDAERDQHDDGKRHALFHVHVLEAVERHVGDHGEARVQGDREHDPGDFVALDAQVVHHPDETGHQSRGRRGRQALEVALVDHGGVDVETRQPQGRACAVDEGRDPAPATEPFKSPLVGDQRWRGAERDHVGQRIHLLAERALGVGHACHPTIQAVQHHGHEHSGGREVEAAVHRHHHGVEAAEQGRQREQVGQDVDALATLAQHDAFGNIARLGIGAIVHGASVSRLSVIHPVSSSSGRPACSS